ncbi:MAG: single-stranded-DNA-specific exonuclease RecJ [Ruminococcus sp.]|nr:single-stranded-DNA-specific exonuclease RecJ [Ruminococcus sp.]
MKKWKIGRADSEKVREFSGRCDIDTLALEVLSARGMNDFDKIVGFFSETELEDPFVIKDMDKAAAAISSSVDAYELICIYGDYDCDGVTSTAILYNYLDSMGANVMYYIPEREDGYGMNIRAIESLAERGVRLIVTVDNGISAIAEAERIAELGMKLVVTDHHQPGEVLPRAEAVVDPHRADCPSAYKDLCGAGVALKLCAALNEGDYSMVLEQYGDICAIGTVADIVPLDGENRTLVKRGLRYLANTEIIGLDLMMDKLKIDRSSVGSDSIAFRLAPVINASGRFGSPLTAVKALLSEDEEDAENYVDTMITLNSMRKQAEVEIMTEIVNSINADPSVLDQRVLVLAGKGWHHGVIGIVASRMVDYFGKPAFIISIDENGEARGSARSVSGLNVFSCLSYCRELLTKYGGHECAGGFSLNEEDIPAFRELIYEFASKSDKPPVAVINADKVLMPEDISVEKVKGLRVLEPVGAGNPQPAFAILGARVDKIVPLSGGKHSKIDFTYGSAKSQALFFGTAPEKLSFGTGDRIDMIVNMELNVFNGRESVSIKVTDYRLSGVKQERYFAAKDTYEKLMRGEELPVSFVRKVIPERSELISVYKAIKESGRISLDDLFMRIASDEMNYCKLHIITDIFRDKGLIEFKPSSGRITFIPAERKVDLEESETLSKLRKMAERRN